jgi:CheY-like chemotaxis protein
MHTARLGFLRNLTLSQAFLAMADKQVLVAEDDDEARGVMVLALQDDGFVVAEARDGVEALRRLLRPTENRDVPMDVIVADIRMPRASGLDLLEELRRADIDIPVVVVTGDLAPTTLAEAERLGAVAVLRKPFDLDDLRTVVLHHALHRSPRH